MKALFRFFALNIYGSMAALLLFFAVLRLQNLLGFPAFLDEILHIDWANDLYDLKPFTGASNGKLFGLWWMAGFGLHGDGALFLARAATVLFNLLGAAALFSLARSLAGKAAGVAAVVLYALSPYGFFYTRMALVDSYVTTWAVLAAWLSMRYITQTRTRDAVLCGLALVATVAAKATGIVIAVIPVLAFLLLEPDLNWRQRARGLLLTYGTFALGGAGFYGVLRWRGYRYFNTATTVAGTKETGHVVSRTLHNIKAMWTIDVAYFSSLLMVIGIALAIYLVFRRRRDALFLLGAALLPLAGLLTVATKLSARYFQFHEPFLLLLVAVALVTLGAELKRRSVWTYRLLPWGAVGLWGVLFAIPFQVRYTQDPASLDLPALDRQEYVSSDAAGFALPELADYLVEQTRLQDRPVIVVGLFANCVALEYYIRDSQPLTVECPLLKLDGSHQPQVVTRIDTLSRGDSPVWIVFEQAPYVSLDGMTVALKAQASFTRPDKLTQIQVLRVVSGSEQGDK